MHFEYNEFTENNPINHASNGGAVALECDFVSVAASRGVASDLSFS